MPVYYFNQTQTLEAKPSHQRFQSCKTLMPTGFNAVLQRHQTRLRQLKPLRFKSQKALPMWLPLFQKSNQRKTKQTAHMLMSCKEEAKTITKFEL
jgi:hypothetical protein